MNITEASKSKDLLNLNIPVDAPDEREPVAEFMELADAMAALWETHRVP